MGEGSRPWGGVKTMEEWSKPWGGVKAMGEGSKPQEEGSRPVNPCVCENDNLIMMM